MNYLRSLFESETAIVLDSEGNAVIGETPFSPMDILRTDDEAYNNEFNNWLSRWQGEQQDKLEQILEIPGNRPRLTDLCRAIREGQVVPFVGSGMSCSSGLPVWNEFLLKMCSFSYDLERKNIEELIENGQFEEAADAIAEVMSAPQLSERIEHDLRLEEGSEVVGPIRLLPELFPKLILTTNLDTVLEQVYVKVEQPFTQILVGSSIARLRQLRASGEKILVKLHGDHRYTEGRVLGTSEYKSAYENTGPVATEITHVYQNNSLLFLGCSLAADRIVQLVADIAAKDANAPKHYAFLKAPATEAQRTKRESFLTARHIFPIWYEEDHDESIVALFAVVFERLGRL